MTSLSHVPTTSILDRLRLAAADIKLAHSVFALPFALLGAFLVAPHRIVKLGEDEVAGSTALNDMAALGPAYAPSPRIHWESFSLQLGLVVVCMVFARTWAMMINRIADRRIDAANPRTARRAVASGRLPLRDAMLFTLAAAAAFIGACSLFWVAFGNPWPLALCVPVLAWIAFYSFTKRFTALCHLFLGGALAASPIAAALAVNPAALAHTPAVFYLAAMVLLWVAGFDVIYALQDVDFDREHRLHSIPARLGSARAIWVSRSLHAGALACLIGAWRSDARLGPVFGVGVALVGALLVAEHVVLQRRGKAGLEMAFFTLNGVVSCVLGAAGIADLTIF
ncbi:MAG: putative 4-hydroxybenzoate polyprenyltransferase [Phycisphaeraceae bacterium]|nr:putative 4-hydroxybenzoate polyprenyltransferase [Phycisphaeraceae bacterium]